MNFPFRHLSIRVPWHDSGWNGTICNQPTLNSACLCLRNIGAKKREDVEEQLRGRSLDDLPEERFPPCVMDRATFMAPFAFTKYHAHPYSKTSPDTHGHFAPTPLRFPSYSAPGVPFRWMQKELVWGREENRKPIRGLDADHPLTQVLAAREPDLKFKTSWMQDAENQKELLNCFWKHIRTTDDHGEDASLVFFYAKQIPLSEEPARRIIVGVGRILRLGDLTEYQYSHEGPCRSMLWERMVTHSIRPDFTDGFLMPYHQALSKMEQNPDFDPSPLVAFAPAERHLEYSYATEHVTPDGALSTLLSVVEALRNAQRLLGGDFSKQIAWIDEQITRLWRQRGPCPGLGAVLGAMGVPLGSFVATEVTQQTGPEKDPWPLVEQMLATPDLVLSKELATQLDSVIGKAWKRCGEIRKAYIRLLSRFDLTLVQARLLYSSEQREERGICLADEDFIQNPYRLYESTRLLPAGLAVSVSIVDRGLFPEDPIRSLVPIPAPSALKSGIDIRRLRALTVERLEFHASRGHTLQPRRTIVSEIRDLPLAPKCDVTSDTIEVAEGENFDEQILCAKLTDNSTGYQLRRMAKCGEVIRGLVEKRVKAHPHPIEADWHQLLDDALSNTLSGGILTERDKQARREKVAALRILATRRLSVLVGPAGTGKTTLLSALVRSHEISRGGVMLLAPTGKARVRMEEKVGDSRFPAKTIAQFLHSTQRFDGAAQRYLLTGQPGDKVAETVIIDECSMMTEEMMASTFEALAGVKRLILVGDHRQLPPIGAGKPFVDIVRFLTPDTFAAPFPKIHEETGYTELTVSMRQSEAPGGRDDARLAGWFTGSELPPGEDDILDLFNGRRQSQNLEIHEWNSPAELQRLLSRSLHNELGENGVLSQERFDRILGATIQNGYAYFNNGVAGKHAETWQILTPVHQHPWGVTEINRSLHNEWRKTNLEASRKTSFRKFCKPVGQDQIVYGDKVINNRNHQRWSWPPGERRTLSNGEIGMVVTKWGSTKEIHVEFSSQPKLNFTYTPSEFSDDKSPELELAYALTVHRAQGSEFGKVFLILPKNRRMLSREMLYTALTRQREKVIILCEGPVIELIALSSDRFSETKTRLTNLFRRPNPKLFETTFLDANLIHQTERGELVRSKSEVIIADHLHRRRINYRYEEPLKLGNDLRIPDFTFEDDDSGAVYYWEHCGMLFSEDYARRWEKKKALYREHGIHEGGGPNGTLIVTRDDSQGGISSKEISELVDAMIMQ